LREVSRAENKNFRVRLRTDGDIQSVIDLAQGAGEREIVNDKGEVPFNHLLRIERAGTVCHRVPEAPAVTVRRGGILTRVSIARERSAFPLTTITLYDDFWTASS